MINLLRDIDSYFKRRPWLLLSIVAGLCLLFIATFLLALVCPPAALAISIGSLSLIGNILPITAISLLTSFLTLILVAQTPRVFKLGEDEIYTAPTTVPAAALYSSSSLNPKTANTTNADKKDAEVEHHSALLTSAKHTGNSDVKPETTHNNSYK